MRWLIALVAVAGLAVGGWLAYCWYVNQQVLTSLQAVSANTHRAGVLAGRFSFTPKADMWKPGLITLTDLSGTYEDPNRPGTQLANFSFGSPLTLKADATRLSLSGEHVATTVNMLGEHPQTLTGTVANVDLSGMVNAAGTGHNATFNLGGVSLNGSSATITLGTARLDLTDIATLGTPASLQSTAAWDVRQIAISTGDIAPLSHGMAMLPVPGMPLPAADAPLQEPGKVTIDSISGQSAPMDINKPAQNLYSINVANLTVHDSSKALLHVQEMTARVGSTHTEALSGVSFGFTVSNVNVPETPAGPATNLVSRLDCSFNVDDIPTAALQTLEKLPMTSAPSTSLPILTDVLKQASLNVELGPCALQSMFADGSAHISLRTMNGFNISSLSGQADFMGKSYVLGTADGFITVNGSPTIALDNLHNLDNLTGTLTLSSDPDKPLVSGELVGTVSTTLDASLTLAPSVTVPVSVTVAVSSAVVVSATVKPDPAALIQKIVEDSSPAMPVQAVPDLEIDMGEPVVAPSSTFAPKPTDRPVKEEAKTKPKPKKPAKDPWLVPGIEDTSR